MSPRRRRPSQTLTNHLLRTRRTTVADGAGQLRLPRRFASHVVRTDPIGPQPMSPRLAIRSEPSAAEHVAEPLLGTGAGRGRLGRRAAAVVERTWQSWPPAGRLYGTAVLGTVLAAGVAATTAKNPLASPAGAAVGLRVATIVTLIAAGLFAQTSKLQARMGGLLIGTGFLSVPWLLNGSSNRVLFSIGVICSSWMPVAFAYLMLAHPTGRLFSRREARFLWLTGGVLATLWLLGVLMTQPAPGQDAAACNAHRTAHPTSSRSVPPPTRLASCKAAIGIAALSLTVGTPILLLRRGRARRRRRFAARSSRTRGGGGDTPPVGCLHGFGHRRTGRRQDARCALDHLGRRGAGRHPRRPRPRAAVHGPDTRRVRK